MIRSAAAASALLLAALALGTGAAGTRPAGAAPLAACYVNEGWAVSAATNADGDGEVFTVAAKGSADEAAPCPLPEGEATRVLGEGEYGWTYQDLVGDHLVVLVSPGAIGNVVVFDLRDGATVLDVSGTYAGSTDGETLRYWARNETEGTPETCPIYDQLTENGLAVGLLDEMELDLATGRSTPTGATDCEGLS